MAKAVQKLFGNTGTQIIGTRHGEKLYETLMTREERLRSEDMGHYFRVAADNRDLNYDKFVVKARYILWPTSLHQPQHQPSGCGWDGQEDPDHRLCAGSAEKLGGDARMNILITGAKGFVGKNLVCNLRNIAEGKNRTPPGLSIGEIYEYDLDTDPRSA